MSISIRLAAALVCGLVTTPVVAQEANTKQDPTQEQKAWPAPVQAIYWMRGYHETSAVRVDFLDMATCLKWAEVTKRDIECIDVKNKVMKKTRYTEPGLINNGGMAVNTFELK